LAVVPPFQWDDLECFDGCFDGISL
jgi:hypothetical protein